MSLRARVLEQLGTVYDPELDEPITTLTGAMAAVQGIKALREKPLKVRSLQAHHAG